MNKTDAERDYEGMREFQMKFIQADQERLQLREALQRIEKHGRELGVGWCIQLAHIVLNSGEVR